MDLLKGILSSFGYSPVALILGILCQIGAIELESTVLQWMCFGFFTYIVSIILIGIGVNLFNMFKKKGD